MVLQTHFTLEIALVHQYGVKRPIPTACKRCGPIDGAARLLPRLALEMTTGMPSTCRAREWTPFPARARAPRLQAGGISSDDFSSAKVQASSLPGRHLHVRENPGRAHARSRRLCLLCAVTSANAELLDAADSTLHSRRRFSYLWPPACHRRFSFEPKPEPVPELVLVLCSAMFS